MEKIYKHTSNEVSVVCGLLNKLIERVQRHFENHEKSTVQKTIRLIHRDLEAAERKIFLHQKQQLKDKKGDSGRT